MGDWILRDGKWLHLPDSPTPVTPADYDPNATRVDLRPVVRGEYAGPTDYRRPNLEDVAARVDDWCEDRSPDELSDNDGRD